MLAIIEALGEWREEEAKKAINNGHCHTKDVSEILDRTAWVKGKEKLKYWGFSYGTILGMTFSTLHPDRVGRVVVDGVMEADDYYNGKGGDAFLIGLGSSFIVGTWMTNLHDTDSIIESFFTQCFSAGPEKCAFYSEEGVEVMREKYIDLFERLKDDPISVHETGKYGPSLITLTDSIDLLRGALYSPRTGFPNLAEILHDILEGNATKFMERKHRLFESNSCLSPACRGAEWSPACYDHQRVNACYITLGPF
jgi:pimeloyl-ACP methyl ester carboxylesterase